MNEKQILSTVEIILTDYGMITLSDLKLFAVRFKKGQYGKFYDRLDGQMIIEALERYVNDRADEFEQHNLNAHKVLKKEESLHPYAPKVLEAIKDAIKPKDFGNPIEESKPVSRVSKFQLWANQFQNLLRKFNDPNEKITTININGTKFNRDQFYARKRINYEKKFLNK